MPEPEEEEEITLCCLPRGGPQACRLRTVAGSEAVVELASSDDAPPPALRLGTLVELRSAAHLYLGEVRGIRERVVAVHIEHAVDMRILAELRQTWRVDT